MVKYGWIITKEHVLEGFAPTEGTREYPQSDFTNDYIAEHGKYFHLLDEDDDVCYEGMIVGEYNGDEPLIEFGIPEWGCERIVYP